MIVWQRVVQLAAKLIPDAILAVFAGGDDKVISRVPITGQDNAIVCLPADLLVSRQGGLNNEVLVAAVQNSITVWRPDQAVDRLAALNDLSSEHAAARPGLDLTILTSGGKSALVAPLDANDGGHVRLADAFLDSSSLADELEGAIATGEGKNLLRTLARHPVHSQNWRVNVHHFGLL